jgi:hypothetical protein
VQKNVEIALEEVWTIGQLLRLLPSDSIIGGIEDHYKRANIAVIWLGDSSKIQFE